ncbi:HNH endonuclease [Pseudomonas sp. NFACC02]|nr:HNH endonuclease [Pseudomonas sp. NFACC02]
MERDYSVAKKTSHQIPTGSYASQSLEEGHIYTRDDLRARFDITASSINTGVFKPGAYDSVWIFITEHKTADRTPYDDVLADDVLHMDGQKQGRTDRLIKEHVERGLELLLFYRKKKYEHPGAGFTYKGRFLYEDHEGARPTKFTLRQESSPALTIPVIEKELDELGEFDPQNIVDARQKVLASVIRRKGQAKFRSALLKAYKGKCAVTGCTVEALLEAAHIVPYQGADTNVVSNGLLLRADIHTLFDLGLLWVDPDSRLVKLAEGLKGSEYSHLHDKPISAPDNGSDHPSAKTLLSHLNALKLEKTDSNPRISDSPRKSKQATSAQSEQNVDLSSTAVE